MRLDQLFTGQPETRVSDDAIQIFIAVDRFAGARDDAGSLRAKRSSETPTPRKVTLLMRATLAAQVRVWAASHWIRSLDAAASQQRPLGGFASFRSSESARRHMFVNITTEADAACGSDCGIRGHKKSNDHKHSNIRIT